MLSAKPLVAGEQEATSRINGWKGLAGSCLLSTRPMALRGVEGRLPTRESAFHLHASLVHSALGPLPDLASQRLSAHGPDDAVYSQARTP